MLLRSGKIKRVYLDCSKDQFIQSPSGKEAGGVEGLDEFIEELESLGGGELNFRDAVRLRLASVKDKRMKELVVRLLEESK